MVEEVAAGWVLELLGLPVTASVGFTTGCSMANFTALAAARHAVLARQGWDVEKAGLFGAPPIEVVIGNEALPSPLGAETGLRGLPSPCQLDRIGRRRFEDHHCAVGADGWTLARAIRGLTIRIR